MSPADSNRKLEDELDALVERMRGELSELALCYGLLKAKGLYEDLYPSTKAGGDRTKQIPKLGICLPFGKFAAKKIGRSPSNIYSKIQIGEELKASLDPDAVALVWGTALANQLGVLRRISTLPPEAQKPLIEIWRPEGAGPKLGKRKLEEAEEAYRIERPKKIKEQEAVEPANDVQPPAESSLQITTPVPPPAELGEPTEVLKLKAGVPYTAMGLTYCSPVDVEIPVWQASKKVDSKKPIAKAKADPKTKTLNAGNWHTAVGEAVKLVASKDGALAARLNIEVQADGARVIQDLETKEPYVVVRYWERASDSGLRLSDRWMGSFPGISVEGNGEQRIDTYKLVSSLALFISSVLRRSKDRYDLDRLLLG